MHKQNNCNFLSCELKCIGSWQTSLSCTGKKMLALETKKTEIDWDVKMKITLTKKLTVCGMCELD